MGGHVRRVAIGSKVFAPGIDYNLCSDPEAACAVLGAGFRTTLVTADVTLQVWLRSRDLERMRRGRPVVRAIAALAEIWAPVQRKLFTDMGGEMDPDNQGFLHDPLAALACIDPAPLRFEELRIATTIDHGTLRTIELDPSAVPGAVLRVATSVDARAAERAIVDAITRA